MTGILLVSLPIPVIARNFDIYYTCVQSVERMHGVRVVAEKEKLRAMNGVGSKGPLRPEAT